MAHQSPILLLTMLFLLVAASHSPTAAADKSLIEKTCNRTSFPEDCVAGLESDAKSHSANSTGLARIAVQTLGVKIGRVLPVVSENVNKARDYTKWSMLVACKDFYSVMPGAVDTAVSSLDQHQYDVAYAGLVNVSSSVNGCRGFGLQEIAQQNDIVFRFTNVSMTIVHLLF